VVNRCVARYDPLKADPTRVRTDEHAARQHLGNPEQRIADLERQLAERTAERDEALERETAAAEVLQVINSSPGDLAPVFDAILEKAHSLCGAAAGALLIRDAERFRLAAIHAEPHVAEYWRQLGPMTARECSPDLRLTRGEPILHLVDLMADDYHRNARPEIRRLNEMAGVRTVLLVALKKNEAVLGVITAYRTEVRPFTEKQIALLQNFAAQAVIAMENARLFDELRHRTDDLQQSLEYQTATSDVLKVISRSHRSRARAGDPR
jgi:GAF domain-containing protein